MTAHSVIRRIAIVVGCVLVTAIACGDNWLTHPQPRAASFAKKCPPNNPHCKTVDTIPKDTVPTDTTTPPPVDTTPTPPPVDTVTPTEPTAPTLLRSSVADTPSPGRIIRVLPSWDLQAVLDTARSGDQLWLAAGSRYTGNFVLPAKGCANGYITITTDGAVQAEGVRADSATAATLHYPRLVSMTSLPVVRTAPGASCYRLTGLEIATDPMLAVSNALVELGDGAATTQSAIPRNIVLDRLYIHGTPTLDLHRCMSLNSDSTAIVDSYIAECHANGIDAQAVWGWGGNGPYKIVNNYLEASSEVLGFGGADPQIQGLVPSDVEIRHNHITRPMTWKGGPWLIKNLIEFKNVRRVLIDGNVLENSWPNGQLGWAFVMWSVNQSGSCTWCVTSDITITNNVVQNVAAGFQINEKYGVAVSSTRYAIRNNVFIGVDNPLVSGGGYGWLIQDNVSNVAIEHNTLFVPSISALEVVRATASVGFVVRNNLTGGGMYALFASPVNSWASVAGSGSAFAGNVVAQGAPYASGYPSGNWYPATFADVGLVGGETAATSVSAMLEQLVLASTSPFKGKATDGTDPGANIAAVLAATAGVKP